MQVRKLNKRSSKERQRKVMDFRILNDTIGDVIRALGLSGKKVL
jgi:hypothetical protein